MAAAPGVAAIGEEVGMAAAPELMAPIMLAQAAPQIADVAKTAIPVAGDVLKTGIPVAGEVAMQTTKSSQAVATEVIRQTPTVLSLPLKMASMTVGVALIVVGVILVLISIAVISAQSNKTAGIMIFFVGFLMAGGGGFLMVRAASTRRAKSHKD